RKTFCLFGSARRSRRHIDGGETARCPAHQKSSWRRARCCGGNSKRFRESHWSPTWNGVDDATGAPAVLGGVIVGENRELADRIHSHVHVQGASRTGVGIIIDHQSVDPKNVFNDAAAGN